jgi:hypothetical protein
MSATDTYSSFLGKLSPDAKKKLEDFIKDQSRELMAARSEDERLRLVHDFVVEAHDRMRKK